MCQPASLNKSPFAGRLRTLGDRKFGPLGIGYRHQLRSSLVCKDPASKNLAVMRRNAINLLRKEKTAKGGIHANLLQCAWDENYFFKFFSV